MLNLQHITKSFRDTVVLDDVSLALNSGDVIALVGENGAGKTTLLNILLGTLRPDAGTVSRGHESVGYVPQEAILGATIADNFNPATEVWRRDYALSLVGLENKLLDTPVRHLSGGQKTRLALAKVLATDPAPTVLLLDEPTNNLDAEGLAWLQQFIQQFRGGIMLVSHDRAFINAVATKAIELQKGKLTAYGGNYNFYKQQKELERQAELERYRANIEERKRLETDLRSKQERARKGLKKSQPTDNDKAQFDWHQNNVQRSFSGQARAARTRLEQLEEVKRPDSTESHKLTLGGTVPNSKLILQLEAIQKYSLQDVNLEIRGNERMHITGRNGAGKTTLLKIAAGLLQPDSGTVTLGTNVTIGYFSQDTDGLDHSKTALENLHMQDVDPTDIYRQARSLELTAEDLKKPVAELSRGQQAKLSFAKLLLGANQLLILDEPTNHLDIPTREQIEAALQNYRGAMLFASHDKYFTEALQTTTSEELSRA